MEMHCANNFGLLLMPAMAVTKPIGSLREMIDRWQIIHTKSCMSAIGTKRTSPSALHMSAFGGKADIASASQNAAFDPSGHSNWIDGCRQARR